MGLTVPSDKLLAPARLPGERDPFFTEVNNELADKGFRALPPIVRCAKPQSTCLWNESSPVWGMWWGPADAECGAGAVPDRLLRN